MAYNELIRGLELEPGLTVNAYDETRYARDEGWRERTKKSRLYVGVRGESLAANFVNRHHRPNIEWAKMVRARVLPVLGLPAKGMRWNVHAGCGSCPCSPGFILPGWFAPVDRDDLSKGFADSGYATDRAAHFHVDADFDILEEPFVKLGALDARWRAEKVAELLGECRVIPAELVVAG
ncbi:MAG TPA: hypothetical protein VMW08_00505 [Acidimicrobiales bacterium]|nr:hypothetical protein [Acidimicrobiales bacterium]